MGLREFTFAGTASSTYNLFITEAAPYNAPPKAVEMIEIPGRNGAYALDKGNFENVEVTYHVCVYDEDNTDFAAEISDVRNWLCSQVGYQRLEDDYNPNEYRMAIYKSGLETDQQFLNGAEFDITFECKPQRWLKSGETAVTMTSGNDITNPTLFDARPQLQVYGYGDIEICGEEISVDNVTIGNIIVANQTFLPLTLPYKPLTINLLNVSLNNGDDIKIDDGYGISIGSFANEWDCTNGTITSASASVISGNFDSVYTVNYSTQVGLRFSLNTLTFNYGTASTETAQVSMTVVGTSIGTKTRTITISVAYDGAYTITVTYSETSVSGLQPLGYGGAPVSKITANSSASALGNPLYIDLDIGECWNEDGGTPVSINNAVSLPAELPTLPSGDTTITFDNTFTKVDIVPRWWKV